MGEITNGEISNNNGRSLIPHKNGEISNKKMKIVDDGSPIPHKKGRFDEEEEKYEWVAKNEDLPAPPPQPKVVEKSNWKPPYFKPRHEMTDEELWLSCPESCNGKVSIDSVKDKFLPVLKKYCIQLHQSEGYDLDENPKIGLSSGCGILKATCCEKSHPEEYKEYMTLAQLAIDETYNKDKKTDLKVLQVKSVNRSGGCFAATNYMTFTAGGGAGAVASTKTFQATVDTWRYFGKDEKYHKVERCRLKG